VREFLVSAKKERKLKNPEEMNEVLGNTLLFGVILAAAVIAAGVILFLDHYASSDTSYYLSYFPDKVPHGNFAVDLPGILKGLAVLNPFSVIELGLLILLATPVARVFLSIFLFYFDGDTRYVYITLAVFSILLFSILVVPHTPFLGG
jgi:uncharacterized membrane protein